MASKTRKKFKDTKVGKLVSKVFSGKNRASQSASAGNARLVFNDTKGVVSNIAKNQSDRNLREKALGQTYVAATGGKNGIIGTKGARVTSQDTAVKNLAQSFINNRNTNKPSGISTAINSLLTTNRTSPTVSPSVAPETPSAIQTGTSEFNLGSGSGTSSASSLSTGTGGGSNMGLPGTSTAGAKAALAETTTANDQVISDAEQARLDYEAKLKGVDNTKKSWLDNLMNQQDNQPSPAEIRQNLEQEYGRKAQVEGINALQETLGQAEAQVATQIAATQDKLGSMNFINNQIAQIERNSAPILNKLRADINFKTGLLTQTDSLIEQAIQDATADSREKWNRSVQLYNMNSDIFDNMRGDIKDAYKEYMNRMEQQHDEDMRETEWKRDMIIKYGLSNSITDSVESITKAVTRKGGDVGISGGGTTGLTPAQQRTFEAYKSQVTSYKSKEDAIKDLEKSKFSIIKAIGQNGYSLLEQEIYNSQLPDETSSWWDRLLGRN